MTLDDRGVRPLSARERRILARLEQSLTGRPREAVPPGPAGDVAMHRADRVAAVIGLLILCGMTAEAAIAGGPVLGLAVGVAFVIMVLVFVRVVRGRR
ncbi:hypothetical protein [Pseudonocardia sp. NPDC049154]|uniref:hypothetical protein n=1 Tax=Pseudonocardia sp. NPDC049154 TaxID=3155501 RepID=UPI0033E76485